MPGGCARLEAFKSWNMASIEELHVAGLYGFDFQYGR